jgi:hypothetical protein
MESSREGCVVGDSLSARESNRKCQNDFLTICQLLEIQNAILQNCVLYLGLILFSSQRNDLS